MRELALFAGAGGGLLASRLLGWRPVCAVEFDGYRRSVLMARQDDGSLEPFPIWDDVRTFDGLPWRGRVDVVSGGFPARRIPPRLEARTRRTISGRKCGESWQMSLPGTYLPRTSSDARSTAQPTTLKRWVTKPARLPYPRQTWVRTTFGGATGFLHTPTATANYSSPSMQKWPNCREFVRVFGTPSPTNHEWLMGWPIGWTALEPLATGRFHAWLRRHSAC